MSICPSVTAHLLQEIFFLWNLKFGYFLTFCQENASFIKIWEEWRELYMKANIQFIISRSVLLRMRNVSDKICRDFLFLFFGPCIFNNEDKKETNKMHKLILNSFITDQSLQHVSAPQSKPSSGSSKSLRVTKPLYWSVRMLLCKYVRVVMW